MQNEPEDKEVIDWSLSIGIYPGILIGARTYDQPESRIFVFYLPFVDFAFEVFYE